MARGQHLFAAFQELIGLLVLTRILSSPRRFHQHLKVWDSSRHRIHDRLYELIPPIRPTKAGRHFTFRS